MPGFVKPTRKVVNIEDAFGELIGKKLIKDLHDNEEICPVCHGTGLRIEDNPYGLSDNPDKRAGQFPYKHQSIRFCPNCYNGVVRSTILATPTRKLPYAVTDGLSTTKFPSSLRIGNISKG